MENKIAQFLKLKRESLGLSQSMVARKMNASIGEIGRSEQKGGKSSIESMLRLLSFYNIGLEFRYKNYSCKLLPCDEQYGVDYYMDKLRRFMVGIRTGKHLSIEEVVDRLRRNDYSLPKNTIKYYEDTGTQLTVLSLQQLCGVYGIEIRPYVKKEESKIQTI